MVIGIDGNEANVKSSVGVSVYTLELLKHFVTHANAQLQFVIYLRETPGPHMPDATQYFKYRIVPGKRLWRDVFFPLYLLFHKDIDMLFCPAHYIPRYCTIPTVVAIHDVAYEYFPDEFLKKDLYKLRNWTAHGLFHSRSAIAVSESTKRDIEKFYHTPADRVHVVYNGFKTYEDVDQLCAPEDVLSKYGLEKQKYFLYVGTLQPRKNIPVLIGAFAHIHEECPDLKLILAGRKGWLYDDIFKTVQELHLENIVLFPGYVPDEEIVHMYRQSVAYILPSLYEGFGIPVAEAMHQGCPVISSNSSSLPEVGGDACLYFEPTDQERLTEHMRMLHTNNELRNELITKGRAQAQKFSSKLMAEQTLQILIDTASK